jgi:NAD(P)-dependent dehydrogenase (short-subunit alcohol dehydrogenase family)
MGNPVAVILGVGPGLGAASARAFGAAGYDVALISRRESALAEVGAGLQGEGITAGWTAADAGDPAALSSAVARLGGHAERIDVLHYNAVAFRPARAGELTPDQLLADLAVGTAGLLAATAAARPLMRPGSVVLATGSVAADRPMASAASLGVQKAALRNLVAALDSDLRRDGIRAASVTVNGTIRAGTAFDPGRIAEVFVRLAASSAGSAEGDWRTEVPYDG